VACPTPATETSCADGQDEDCDAATDCADSDCAADPGCVETICNDMVDNDNDGLTDCADPDCAAFPGCVEAICNDLVDNDNDGLTDCADPDCAAFPGCVETVCDDMVDNDNDGLTDCADPDCAAFPGCFETNCTDGIDNDTDGQTDCDDSDCVQDPACGTLDFDGDGTPNAADCAPIDPGSELPPPEIPLLRVDRSGATDGDLTWTDVSGTAGSAVRYDIVSDLISNLPVANDTCHVDDQTGITYTDTRLTGISSTGFYHVVRAQNDCLPPASPDGTYGVDSMANLRTGACP
jgi:hypothetical protein